MHIFTPVLALLATLDFGAEARSGFRTVTATSPLQTRGLETRTVKKQCNRLAVCAADTVTKLESRSPKKKVDADNYKPKYPIIFERCVDICHREWPGYGDTQECCDYCDTMMGCCPAPDGEGVPVLCQSGRFQLPRGTAIKPEPSQEELLGSMPGWNLTDEERLARHRQACMEEPRGHLWPDPEHDPCADVPGLPALEEGPHEDVPMDRWWEDPFLKHINGTTLARFWEEQYSRKAEVERRVRENRPPLTDGRWEQIKRTRPPPPPGAKDE